MNSCHFIGRISKDIAIKQAASGVAYCQFDLAVKQKKSNNVDFIHCVAYDQIASVLTRYTSKGYKIAISGVLRPSIAHTKEGIDVERYVIVVEEMEFVERVQKPKEEKKPSIFDETNPWEDLKK